VSGGWSRHLLSRRVRCYPMGRDHVVEEKERMKYLFLRSGGHEEE
jgi:hypothetical protein